jgi:transcription elongation factor GreA
VSTDVLYHATRTTRSHPTAAFRRGQPTDATPVLTADGRRQLAAKAERLRVVMLPELRDALADRHRDVTVEDDYERAVAELRQLEDLLSVAESVDALPEDPEVVELGDLVTLEVGDEIERYVIVHPVEAPLDHLRISVAAPLAQALLGHHVGEQVEVRGPRATYRARVLGATRVQEHTTGG